MMNDIEISDDPGPTQEQVDAQNIIRVTDDAFTIPGEYIVDPESGSLRRAFPKNQHVVKAGAKRRHHRKP